MNPIDQHVATMGPWQWLGWVLFAALAVLYGALWRSSRAVELRALKKALQEARASIDELKALEMELKNRNDKLRTDYNRLHSEYTDLRQQLSRLEVAFGAIGDKLAATREELASEKKLRDQQYEELMRAKAKNGDL